MRLKVFLDDRIQLHMPQAPHSHTPKPSNRKHDLLWLTMKQRHEEVDRKMDKVLILAYNTFEKRQEGGGNSRGHEEGESPQEKLVLTESGGRAAARVGPEAGKDPSSLPSAAGSSARWVPHARRI